AASGGWGEKAAKYVFGIAFQRNRFLKVAKCPFLPGDGKVIHRVDEVKALDLLSVGTVTTRRAGGAMGASKQRTATAALAFARITSTSYTRCSGAHRGSRAQWRCLRCRGVALVPPPDATRNVGVAATAAVHRNRSSPPSARLPP
uniref:Uncharacterized protein n=1 Tax=Oryza glaberrima TaxID=4538 RepID=I1QAS7_ORYGL